MPGVGHRQKMSIDYFLPLSNPYQSAEERSFEEDIEMRVEDENEGFEDEEMIDEERGQLRNSRVEVEETTLLFNKSARQSIACNINAALDIVS